MAAVEYLSQDWANEMRTALAEEFSTRGVVSTVFVQVVTGCPDGQDAWTLIELAKGRMVRYEVGVGTPPEYELAAEGTYKVHKGCVTGEIDGSQCIMTGEMKLLGNVTKAMSLLGTYSRLEEVAKSVEVL